MFAKLVIFLIISGTNSLQAVEKNRLYEDIDQLDLEFDLASIAENQSIEEAESLRWKPSNEVQVQDINIGVLLRIWIESESDRSMILTPIGGTIANSRSLCFSENFKALPKLEKRNLNCRVEIKKGINKFYIRSYQEFYPQGVYLHTELRMQSRIDEINIYGGIIYGISVSIIIFNIGLFIFFKKFYFCGYLMYLVSALYLLAAGNTHLYISTTIWELSVLISGIGAFLYHRGLLDLPTHFKHSDKILVIIHSFGAISVFSNLALDTGFSFHYVANVCSFSILVYYSFRRLISGYKPASFMVAGWCIQAVGIFIYLINFEFIRSSQLYWAPYISFTIEIILFSFASGYRLMINESEYIRSNKHAIKQLEKVFYPHQIAQIKSGEELEKTMPTNLDDGIVISLDIVNSSKIRHLYVKDFFEDALRQCISLLNERYDSESMTSNGYRIKEMGDGFLCSIGYPFTPPNNENPADLAVELSLRFIQKIEESVAKYGIKHQVHCGIGIALGSLHGFYPIIGTKEYDIFGRGIILSKRYEAMRKNLFPDQNAHSIILHTSVYNSLGEANGLLFKEMPLKEPVFVRDDPEAQELYFALIPFGDRKKEGCESIPFGA